MTKNKNKNQFDNKSSNKLIEPVTDKKDSLSKTPTPNSTPISSPQINSNENKDNINNILLNMKIISEIKESDKLLTNNDCLEIDTRYVKFVQRWWYEDGREVTLIQISDIIDNLFNFIDINYCANSNFVSKGNFDEDKTHLFQRIHLILQNSIKGLENLKTTYKNDIKTISQIDLIIEKVNIRIERMSAKVKLT
tara:strand:+ start:1212 stop:1793 length:582 start_codon:yes stop_codon:yes gene_type:complete